VWDGSKILMVNRLKFILRERWQFEQIKEVEEMDVEIMRVVGTSEIRFRCSVIEVLRLCPARE